MWAFIQIYSHIRRVLEQIGNTKTSRKSLYQIVLIRHVKSLKIFVKYTVDIICFERIFF